MKILSAVIILIASSLTYAGQDPLPGPGATVCNVYGQAPGSASLNGFYLYEENLKDLQKGGRVRLVELLPSGPSGFEWEIVNTNVKTPNPNQRGVILLNAKLRLVRQLIFENREGRFVFIGGKGWILPARGEPNNFGTYSCRLLR